MKASLNQVWSMINSQQVSVHSPMFERAKFPANTVAVNQFLITIATFDLIDTESWLDGFVFYLPEGDPYSLGFDQCGYGSTVLIQNISIIVWTWVVTTLVFFAYFPILLISRYCGKLTNVKNKLAAFLFWNGLLRSFMEFFFDMFIAAMLNIKTATWLTPFWAEKFSNLFSLGFVGITLILLPTLTVICYINVYNYGDKYFTEAVGALLEGTNLRRKRHILIWPAAFFLRRITFAFTSIYLGWFLWAQFAIQFAFSILMILFLS